MYCTAALLRYTAFRLLQRNPRPMYRVNTAIQYIIYVEIRAVILRPLNGPYTAPYRLTWEVRAEQKNSSWDHL